MSTRRLSSCVETLQVGALAGLAGGVAEVGWITLYGTVTGAPTEAVARGVVGSVFPTLAASASSIWLGVVIHLALALALGLGLALATRLLVRDADPGYSDYALVVPILVAVWAVNFLVALPYLNPDFVRLLPYSVTILSKLLFGLSAAAVFRAERLRRARIQGYAFPDCAGQA